MDSIQSVYFLSNDKYLGAKMENLAIIDVRGMGCLSLESRGGSLNFKGKSLSVYFEF